MADEDLRAHQRAAAAGDPEAQQRFKRALCRKHGHRWSHYKGGDHLCEVCGERSPNDPREPGAQTMYGSPRRNLLQGPPPRTSPYLAPWEEDPFEDGPPEGIDPFAHDPEFDDLGGL